MSVEENVTRSWTDMLLSGKDFERIVDKAVAGFSHRLALRKHYKASTTLLAEFQDREKRARAEAYRECAERLDKGANIFLDDGSTGSAKRILLRGYATEFGELAAKSEAEEKVG